MGPPSGAGVIWRRARLYSPIRRRLRHTRHRRRDRRRGRPIPVRSVAGNGPDVPDGPSLYCIRILTIVVGGPNDAAVSDCQQAIPTLPVCVCAPLPTPTPPANLTMANESPAAASASSPTPAVAAAVSPPRTAVSLPRTGDPSGGGWPARNLTLLFGTSVAVAATAVTRQAWRVRQK